MVEIQEGLLTEAIDTLESALVRTDGCVNNGLPDGPGSGRDWVTDCNALIVIYPDFQAAIDVLSGAA